ncbi:unnamed protein product [Staurois parvus]|uniref:Uncharacterized protein n=1 Tax=Staurois parvus TaxID=386267 RepID=A0ABN9GDU4_9NEOB|nr:unnamed protein product [Staurois parvus]
MEMPQTSQKQTAKPEKKEQLLPKSNSEN